MPVVVTGATGFVGRHVIPAFRAVSPEVRAYIRDPGPAPALREQGAKVAVGEFSDLDLLEVVMEGAHTVCHLVGGLSTTADRYEADVLGSLEAVLEAARRSGVRRVLVLSCAGASSEATNPYLRAKGMAEEAVRGSGLEHVVIRSTHLYGPGSRWLREMRTRAAGRLPTVIGNGRQELAPVFVDDAAAVLVAADDRDRLASGTWGLEGPDRLTADRLCDLLAGRARRKLHLSPRRAAAGRSPHGYGRAAFEVLAMDSVADAPGAAVEFGVRTTSLADGLRRSFVAEGRIH